MSTILKLGLAVVIVFARLFVAAFGDDARTWILDDFEDGDLRSASGSSWLVLADDLMGGSADVRLDVVPGGPATKKHALRLSGRLGGGTPSFAGAWMPLEKTGRSLDLSAFEGIRLRVKGPAKLDVGFRIAAGANFLARVEAGPEWTLVDVPFSTLRPTGRAPEGVKWTPAALQTFGVTTPQVAESEAQRPGAIAFEIDDVAFYERSGKPAAPAATGPAMGLAVVPFASLASIPSTGWTELATDPEGDSRMKGLPDAVRLEAVPSAPGNMLWLRVTLRETPHDRWFGMNVALDIDGDPANGFAWWGANTAFKFDRIVTVWCFHVADGCQGYVGMADSAQAAAGVFISGDAGLRFRFAVDVEHRAYLLGLPRDALGLQGQPARLVAAVGSALVFADDVPGQGAVSIR